MKALYYLKNVWILCLGTCSLLASSDSARFSPTIGSAHYRDSSLGRALDSAMVIVPAESSPELVIEEEDIRGPQSLEETLAPDQSRCTPLAIATLPQAQAQELAGESLTGAALVDTVLVDTVGSASGDIIPSPGFPFLLDMDTTVIRNAWNFTQAGRPLKKLENQIFASPYLLYKRYCNHPGKAFSRGCGHEERPSEPTCRGDCKPAFSGFLAEFGSHQIPVTSELIFTDDRSLPPYSWLVGFIKHSKEQLNLKVVNQIKMAFFSPPLALDEHYAKDLQRIYHNITDRRNIVSFVEQPARINIFATRRQWWGLSIDLPYKMYDNNASKGRRIQRYYGQALHRWAFRQEALLNDAFQDEEEALEKIGLDCSGKTLWTSLLGLFGGYHSSAIVVD